MIAYDGQMDDGIVLPNLAVAHWARSNRVVEKDVD